MARAKLRCALLALLGVPWAQRHDVSHSDIGTRTGAAVFAAAFVPASPARPFGSTGGCARGSLHRQSRPQSCPSRSPTTPSSNTQRHVTTGQRDSLIDNIPVPNKDEGLSKYQKDFRNLLEAILYTQDEIEAVPYYNVRVVVDGIGASYSEPAVYRAFEVLYEDHAPLRVAGRVVHSRVKSVVEDAIVERRKQTERITETIRELDESDIHRSWMSFGDFAKGKQLGLRQFKNAVAPVLTQLDGVSLNEDDLARIVYKDGRRNADFADVVIGIRDIVDTAGHQPSALKELIGFDRYNTELSDRAQKKKDRFNERYDEMLKTFEGWKDRIPEGKGRRYDILRGCFVGSENAKVVEALRVIYTENPSLRVCGDWIFKIVSTLMGSAKDP